MALIRVAWIVVIRLPKSVTCGMPSAIRSVLIWTGGPEAPLPPPPPPPPPPVELAGNEVVGVNRVPEPPGVARFDFAFPGSAAVAGNLVVGSNGVPALSGVAGMTVAGVNGSRTARSGCRSSGISAS
jgi:hypothetical protein